MINVMVFDLDDTLFAEREFVLSGFRAVDDWLADHHSISGFSERAKAAFDSGSRGRIFNQILQEIGALHDAEFIQQLVRIYREHKPSISLFPDARWAIEHFRRQKKLGIITDGYLVTQYNKISALGIAAQFNAIVYSDTFGRDHWKPSLTPYRKLAEQIRCEGAECVYIGDNPAKDFLAAKVLGWRTVRIRRDGGEYGGLTVDAHHEAEIVLESLYELEGISQ